MRGSKEQENEWRSAWWKKEKQVTEIEAADVEQWNLVKGYEESFCLPLYRSLKLHAEYAGGTLGCYRDHLPALRWCKSFGSQHICKQ